MFDSIKPKKGRCHVEPLLVSEQIRRLKSKWRTVCTQYLPLHSDGSIWRYSRGWLPSDPHQGWKIHISATILTACDVLQAVGPYLRKSGVAFKAAAKLDDLARINSGLHHGYSQVGKFMTIYPLNMDNFCEIVEDIHRLLPTNIAAPVIPFDYRYRESIIFYRYGLFVAKGGSEAMLRALSGELVPDRRNIPAPDWVASPFAEPKSSPDSLPQSPFRSRYHVFRSLSQRGKGGVYEAIDTGTGSVRICIIKEGRMHGETAWDGRDGRVRVVNEAKVLADLRATGLDVPIIYDSFETEGNFYLVLEKIDGKNLQTLVTKPRRRLRLVNTLYVCKQISRVLADIHAAGWVWRDCKPANLFLTADNTVRPVDFEGACPANQPDSFVWSSPNFTAPEIFGQKSAKSGQLPGAEDLYSLGSTLFYLFEGKLPPNKAQCHAVNNESQPSNCDCAVNNRNVSLNNYECRRVKFLRRGVPDPVKQVISRLLSVEPALRPGAEEVFAVLSLVESHLLQKRRKTQVVSDGIEERFNL